MSLQKKKTEKKNWNKKKNDILAFSQNYWISSAIFFSFKMFILLALIFVLLLFYSIIVGFFHIY